MRPKNPSISTPKSPREIALNKVEWDSVSVGWLDGWLASWLGAWLLSCALCVLLVYCP